MVFAAHGMFGTSCITSLTVQSTMGVRATHPVEAEILTETLKTLEEDIPAAGIKIGMLGTAAAVEAVVGFLEALRGRGSRIAVVVDPVLKATSGSRLLAPGAAHLLRTRLLPLADWVTPNMEELGWLTTLPTTDRGQIELAAKRLQSEVAEQGGRQINVLAKGGDLEVPDDLMLLTGGETVWLPGRRIETTSTHGTGCALSSALMCRLVAGVEAVEAARGAKEYVAEAMRRAVKIGRGKGPMNLLWPLR